MSLADQDQTVHKTKMGLEYKPTTGLARLYCSREQDWKAFLSEWFPDARLIKWGGEQRTFRWRGRAIKVQCTSRQEITRDGLHDLDHEARILRRLEGYVWVPSPRYWQTDNWKILELDWIDGQRLDDLARAGDLSHVPIRSVLGTAVKISMRGVAYHQLRPKHMFCGTNGEITCIDFGGSRITSILQALAENLAPIKLRYSARLERHILAASPLFSLIKRILKDRYTRMARCKAEGAKRYPLADSLRRVWLRSCLAPMAFIDRIQALVSPYSAAGRVRESLSGSLPGHSAQERLVWALNASPVVVPASSSDNSIRSFAAEAVHLERAKSLVSSSARSDPSVLEDMYSFELSDFSFYGRRNWGFTWDRIRTEVDFKGKRILDLGCTQGMLCTFARIEGAAHATGVDECPSLVKAARSLASGFGIPDNEYVCAGIDLVETWKRDSTWPDLAAALSTRFCAGERERLLRFLVSNQELLCQIRGDLDAELEYFRSLDFRILRTIDTGEPNSAIVYAAR
jgi:hypothetical protein